MVMYMRSPRRGTLTALLGALAALAGAEDAPSGGDAISPEALKAFGALPRAVGGTPPVVNPLLRPPAAPTANGPPPEIILPHPQPAGGAAAVAPADFGGFDDLRLAWMGGPAWCRIDADGNRRFTASRPAPGQSASVSWLGSPGLSASGGLLLGFTAAGAWVAADEGAAALRLRSTSIDLAAGFGLPIDRNLQCEVTPFVGGTRVHGRFSGAAGTVDLSGYGLEWGVRGAAVYTCEDGLQGGITAGYGGSAAGLDGSDGARYALRSEGLLVGGFIGLRF